MDFNEYQDLAQRTSSTISEDEKLDNGILGLCGEVGEVSEHLKKYWFHGKKLDSYLLMEELGDVLWYIAEMCEGLGIYLEDVATHNIQKLMDRWPDGFKKEDDNA